MMKSILVALDGSQHADSALEHGLWLARRLRARLIGLHVLDIVSIEGSFLHDVSGSLGFEPYLDFSSKMREALQERGWIVHPQVGVAGFRVDLGIVHPDAPGRYRTLGSVLIWLDQRCASFETPPSAASRDDVISRCNQRPVSS